jgi:cold-inducible RNA-binding protein
MQNIFVGNLPVSTTAPKLRLLFEAHGAVERVNIVTDRDTGRPRGFAFVQMTNADQANHAMAALNGRALNGRPLRVSEALGRTPRPDDYARQPRRPRW